MLALSVVVAAPAAALSDDVSQDDQEPVSEQDASEADASDEDDAPNGDDDAPNGDWGASSNFDKVLVEDDIGEPMTMDIASDGRIFMTDRGGELRVHDQETGETTIAADIDTYSEPHYPGGNNEGGLLGVALDPDFDDNQRIYLYYSDPVPDGDQVFLSRFEMDGDELDLDSEIVLLEVPSQRETCCHLGGDLKFGLDGELYLSIGDETLANCADQYAPINEDPDFEWAPWCDAQGTAGDTSDLRGKILRIIPLDDPGDEPGVGSTYEVPDDNLFTSGEYDDLFPDGEYDPELARPEIYVMGARNPFRIAIDEETGWLYYGMYGPNNPEWNDERGPMGFDQWHQAREASNQGWPFCTGDLYPYRPWDFAADEPKGDWFDCEGGPENTSPNNDGLTTLPPVTPAIIYYPIEWDTYPYEVPEPFLNLGEGAGGPNSGPVYRYDEELDSDTKFPEHFDGRWFLLDGHRDHLKTAVLDDEGDLADIEHFMDDTGWAYPHHAMFGPNGSLYVIEYGNAGGFEPNEDAALYRIDWVGDDGGPTCPDTDEPPEGFEKLYDGETLDGWTMAGPGGFEIDDCGLLQPYGGMGLLWYEEQEFTDYVLHVDFRVHDEADNSGVFVRFPDPDDDPWNPVDEGFEIQIYEATDDPLTWTGSVYTFAPAEPLATNDLGEWNSMQIEVVDQDYTVTVNDVEVATYTNEDDSRGQGGYVGLQNHAEDQEPGENVEFRNVWINDLDDDPGDPDQPVTASLDPETPDGENDWYVSPVTVSLESDDDDALLEWSLAGEDDWVTYTEPVTFDEDGIYDLEYRAYWPADDENGNGEDDDGQDGGNGEDENGNGQDDGSGEDDGSSDSGAADVTTVLAGVDGWNFDPDEVVVDQGDTVVFEAAEAGHNVVIEDEDGDVVGEGGDFTSNWTYEFAADEAGDFTFRCAPHPGMDGTLEVVGDDGGGDPGNGDGDGDYSDIYEVSFSLDQTPPATEAEVSGQDGEPEVSLDAQDVTSGVEETHYQVDGGEEQVYEGPFTVDAGAVVEFRSVDVAGNVEDWQSVDVDDPGEPGPPGEVCARHQGGATFPDAPGSGHRFFIDCLAELGIVQGYADGTYGPRDDVSREQLASYVVRALELATGESLESGGELFPDVSPTSTHGEAVYKLRNAGIVLGYEDGTFQPRVSVSRDQTARYVVNALEYVLDEPLPSSGIRFPDVTTTQYVADIDKLATAGVIQGFEDGTFGPRDPVTRAQMARFIGSGLEVLAAEGAYEGP